MAITFKGERTVAELNNNLSGFIKYSAFRIYDHGTLLKGNVPVKHGDFVSWTGTQWKIEPSLEYATSADVEAIEEQVEAFGQPFQWKGPATVSKLNDGIEGIRPGWTYTLTNAGTLTDGSVAVDVGDEVAWTEDDEWFKVGGDSGKIAVFQFSGSNYPSLDSLVAEWQKGKTIVLIHNPASTENNIYYLVGYVSGSGHFTMYFAGRLAYIRVNDTTGWTFQEGFVRSNAIASDYDKTATYYLGDVVMYQGYRYVCKVAVTTPGAFDFGHWTQKSVEDEIGSVKNGGALTSAASVDVPNNAVSTLSSSEAALTLNVNVGAGEIPNFAVEITAGANITLTVTKTVGGTTTTLNYSASAGNSLESGKLYQVTCVGSCWTLAEFTVPTP